MAISCSFPFLAIATCSCARHGTVNLRQSVWHTKGFSIHINEFSMAIWQYQSLKFDLGKE